MSELLSWFLRLSPALWRKLISACICNLVLPVTTHSSWELDGRWTVKSKALPSGSAPSSPQWSGATSAVLVMLHQTACPSQVPLSHRFPIVNKTTRYFNSFAWGRSSPPSWMGQSSVGSGTEPWPQTWVCCPLSWPLYIGLQTAPSACWRSQTKEARKTTSSAKSRFCNSEVPRSRHAPHYSCTLGSFSWISLTWSGKRDNPDYFLD